MYVYDLAGVRQSTEEIVLLNNNDTPQGISAHGSFAYVGDWLDDRIYAYSLSSGLYSFNAGFTLTTGITLVGVSVTDDLVYVVSRAGTNSVHVYDHAGVRQTGTILFSAPNPKESPSRPTGYTS